MTFPARRRGRRTLTIVTAVFAAALMLIAAAPNPANDDVAVGYYDPADLDNPDFDPDDADTWVIPDQSGAPDTPLSFVGDPDDGFGLTGSGALSLAGDAAFATDAGALSALDAVAAVATFDPAGDGTIIEVGGVSAVLNGGDVELRDSSGVLASHPAGSGQQQIALAVFEETDTGESAFLMQDGITRSFSGANVTGIDDATFFGGADAADIAHMSLLEVDELDELPRPADSVATASDGDEFANLVNSGATVIEVGGEFSIDDLTVTDDLLVVADGALAAIEGDSLTVDGGANVEFRGVGFGNADAAASIDVTNGSSMTFVGSILSVGSVTVDADAKLVLAGVFGFGNVDGVDGTVDTWEVDLNDGTIVALTVDDTSTGERIADATVDIDGPGLSDTRTTDANGTIEFVDELEPGADYDLTVSADGYQTREATFTASSIGDWPIGLAQVNPDPEPEPEPEPEETSSGSSDDSGDDAEAAAAGVETGNVNVFVYDAEELTGLEGVTVRLLGDADIGEQRTNEDGEAIVNEVPGGEWTVTAYIDDTAVATDTIDHSPPGATPVELEVEFDEDGNPIPIPDEIPAGGGGTATSTDSGGGMSGAALAAAAAATGMLGVGALTFAYRRRGQTPATADVN